MHVRQRPHVGTVPPQLQNLLYLCVTSTNNYVYDITNMVQLILSIPPNVEVDTTSTDNGAYFV